MNSNHQVAPGINVVSEGISKPGPSRVMDIFENMYRSWFLDHATSLLWAKDSGFAVMSVLSYYPSLVSLHDPARLSWGHSEILMSVLGSSFKVSSYNAIAKFLELGPFNAKTRNSTVLLDGTRDNVVTEDRNFVIVNPGKFAEAVEKDFLKMVTRIRSEKDYLRMFAWYYAQTTGMEVDLD